MERKLVKQGRNALTVTLPAKWLKQKNLSAGDSVKISEQGRNLLIESDITAEVKKITVDMRNSPGNLPYVVVQGKYIEGYDIITAQHNNVKLSQKVVQTLLGMIVAEHTDSHIVYKNLIAVPADNFESVFRRVTHILLQQARMLADLVEMARLNQRILGEKSGCWIITFGIV